MTDHAPTEPLDLDAIEAEASGNITVFEHEVPDGVVPALTKPDRTILALCRALRERDAEIAKLRKRPTFDAVKATMTTLAKQIVAACERAEGYQAGCSDWSPGAGAILAQHLRELKAQP